jgi:hypothetical protein
MTPVRRATGAWPRSEPNPSRSARRKAGSELLEDRGECAVAGDGHEHAVQLVVGAGSSFDVAGLDGGGNRRLASRMAARSAATRPATGMRRSARE